MRVGRIVMAIGTAMIVATPWASSAQDWGRPEGYADRQAEAGAVLYSGGRFEYQGRGRWTEFGPGDTVKANFTELSRSADWIDLDDQSRDVQIRLNLKARTILITERGGSYRPLYTIQSITDARAPTWNLFGRPQGSGGMGNREIGAGGAVIYNGGRFEYQGGGRWTEFGPGDTVKANFEELSRDSDGIELRDPSRDVQIRLNLKARTILFTERGSPYRQIYSIQSITTARGPARNPFFGRPPGGEGMGYREGPPVNEREIEAGTWLVTQFDAQRVCPAVAGRAGGQWTGGYRTTQQAVMSVCTVRFAR